MKTRFFASLLGLVLAFSGCTQKLENENAELRRELSAAAAKQKDTDIKLAKQEAQLEAQVKREAELIKAEELAAAAAAQRDADAKAQELRRANEITKLTEQLGQLRLDLQKAIEQSQRLQADAERLQKANERCEVKGVISYYFNRNYGYKPDAGARICFFKPEDYPAFDIARFKKYFSAKYAATPENAAAIAAWKALGDDQSLYVMISDATMGRQTVRLSADGSGSFSTKLKPGHYIVIVTSAHQKQINMLEVGGEIAYQEIDVVVGDETNVDMKF